MKKIVCLFGVLALTLTSCSKDDDNTNGNNIFLPKTIQRTDEAFPVENKISTIVYDGNKIVSITNQFTKIEFTYTGNLITKKIDYNVSGVQPTKNSETSYAYANGKLQTVSSSITGIGSNKTEYTYNSDGTIKKETYITTSGVEVKLSNSELFTVVNGNLTKIVSSGPNTTITDVYNYDTKNNVFKNVLGFSLLLDQQITHSLGQDIYSSVNNIEKSTETINSNPIDYTAKYDYNAKGYPIKKTSYNQDGTVKEVFDYTY